jgi:hypothetical protein
VEAAPEPSGLVHYLIHAYDYPTLAAKGVAAADYYAASRLGSRTRSTCRPTSTPVWGCGTNPSRPTAASAEAARSYARRYHPDAANYNELHALDYLAYAYLQTAQDGKAREVAGRLAAIDRTYPEVDFAVAYAAGAIPARIALERQAWQEAATLPPPSERLVARFPYDAAHVELAHALGRVHTGDLAGARKAMAPHPGAARRQHGSPVRLLPQAARAAAPGGGGLDLPGRKTRRSGDRAPPLRGRRGGRAGQAPGESRLHRPRARAPGRPLPGARAPRRRA